MSKATLIEDLQVWDNAYVPAKGLVQMPLTATYHTGLKRESHAQVLALFPSMSYAFDLLQHGKRDGIERAAHILRVLLPLQDKDASRDTYGIWPYFYEESLDEMDRPDWNMADFHGKKLVLILKLYADLLPADVVKQVRESVFHACQAIIKRNVGPHYTNIAIMGAFVTLGGGEALQDEEIRQYGLQRLKRFYEFTNGIGAFSEYNSPCYTPIAIQELNSVYKNTHTAEAIGMASELLDLAWRMIAQHYHASTQEWGGPYSRTYHTMLTERDRRFLNEALSDDQSADSNGIRCPNHYKSYFKTDEERYFTEATMMESETGYQCYATTYQNEKFTLGSYTHGSMWNQRRNLIGFIDAGSGRKVSVLLQFLKDGKDFCSAIFTGVQSRDEILYGFNLATDNGAWHQDLDIINGRFQASDLRIRIGLGGDVEQLELPIVQDEKKLSTVIGTTRLNLEAILDESDYGTLEAKVELEPGALNLDYVIYAGTSRDFDFHELQKAVWMFALSVGEAQKTPPKFKLTPQKGAMTAETGHGEDRMSITLPVAPGKTGELYRGTVAQLPQSLLRTLK
jgi:hypothetical protein